MLEQSEAEGGTPDPASQRSGVVVWRQQGIFPHEPQHPLAGNSNTIEHPQPRPYLAVTLADPGRTVEIGGGLSTAASEIASLGPRRDSGGGSRRSSCRRQA